MSKGNLRSGYLFKAGFTDTHTHNIQSVARGRTTSTGQSERVLDDRSLMERSDNIMTDQHNNS